MKLLFVLGSVYPRDDANSNIMNRIAEYLLSQNQNIQIFEVGINNNNEIISKYKIRNIEIYGMGDPFITRLSPKLRNYLAKKHAASRWNRIKLLVKHPYWAIEYVIKKFMYGNIQIIYKKQVQEICHKEGIDAIICVSYPFQTALYVSKLKVDVPFVYYQLDPYYSHYKQQNKWKALRQEEYVCNKASHIFMTNLIYQDYSSSSLSKYLTKSTVIEFPAIEISSMKEHSVVSNEERVINMAFVGTLYEDIRSPEFLFRLLENLVLRGNMIHLHLIGPIVGNIRIPQAEWITYHGRLNAEDAKWFMHRADFLINIGNLIINQMPSKIFEYFSSGKPIINLYKTNQCPTLPYASKYPNCINIAEFELIDNKMCECVESFLKDNKDINIPSEYIRDLFPEYTTVQVASKFLQIIQNVVKLKKK